MTGFDLAQGSHQTALQLLATSAINLLTHHTAWSMGGGSGSHRCTGHYQGLFSRGDKL